MRKKNTKRYLWAFPKINPALNHLFYACCTFLDTGERIKFSQGRVSNSIDAWGFKLPDGQQSDGVSGKLISTFPDVLIWTIPFYCSSTALYGRRLGLRVRWLVLSGAVTLGRAGCCMTLAHSPVSWMGLIWFAVNSTASPRTICGVWITWKRWSPTRELAAVWVVTYSDRILYLCAPIGLTVSLQPIRWQLASNPWWRLSSVFDQYPRVLCGKVLRQLVTGFFRSDVLRFVSPAIGNNQGSGW